jgi:NAD(P)-dependent dehydrogenase (short-subunit alcohol dehydrogenase family)
MKELSGRVAVVTGGASGIGRGMAEAFADEGMKLVVADVEEAALEKAVAELESRNAEVIGVRCDVADPESVEALAQKTLDTYGAVHVVCNNAGVAGSSGAYASWEAPLADWEWGVGVNLWGVVHGHRSFIPKMIAGGDEGHIVNTASMAGLMSGSGIYGLTKHAVVAISESIFTEFQSRGLAKLSASVLCPGWVNTRIMESERNRKEAPREAPGELRPEFELMRKMVEQWIKEGLDPKEVGKLVVDSIREKRFYILTHPTWMPMIEHRMQNILQGREPSNIPPPGQAWPGQPGE